jgi:hypothetical protein
MFLVKLALHSILTLDLAGHSDGTLGYLIEGLTMPVCVVGDALFAGAIGGCPDSEILPPRPRESAREHVFTSGRNPPPAGSRTRDDDWPGEEEESVFGVRLALAKLDAMIKCSQEHPRASHTQCVGDSTTPDQPV